MEVYKKLSKGLRNYFAGIVPGEVDEVYIEVEDEDGKKKYTITLDYEGDRKTFWNVIDVFRKVFGSLEVQVFLDMDINQFTIKGYEIDDDTMKKLAGYLRLHGIKV